MNTRLKQFLSVQNITQAQFADNINVVRASVSHVLSGRNNPSYDFIKAIMQKYPYLNIEWLIFGKGKMYKDYNDSLFADEENSPEPQISDPVESPLECNTARKETTTLEETSEIVVKQRKVSKIIILYDDGTYQEINEKNDSER